MNEELSRVFVDLIMQEINNLKVLEPGTQEYERTVDDVAKLYKLKIDEVKNQWEYSEKFERAEKELELKERQIDNEKTKSQREFERSEKELELKEVQLKEQKIDRWIKLGVDGTAIVLPIAFYAVWMGLGFKFEENGVFKSRVFQSLFNKFKVTR